MTLSSIAYCVEDIMDWSCRCVYTTPLHLSVMDMPCMCARVCVVSARLQHITTLLSLICQWHANVFNSVLTLSNLSAFFSPLVTTHPSVHPLLFLLCLEALRLHGIFTTFTCAHRYCKNSSVVKGVKPVAQLTNVSTDTHGYVAVDISKSTVYVVFRGTEDLRNWCVFFGNF